MIGGSAFAPADVSSAVASSRISGCSNSIRTGTCLPNDSPSRWTSLVASSELPPSSKKLSDALICSIPSSSATTPATWSSVAVVSGSTLRSDERSVGAGNADRSSFPTGVSGT